MSIEAKTAILEHLGRQHQAMVALLADLVNIDSGSYNKRGVDAVGDRLRVWLDAAGISCEKFPHETFGDCMAARLPASGGGNRPIVLMGHRDTVFPDGTAAQRPFRIDGDQAFGPGVADIKAGLVMNTFVLEAFRRFGAPCPLTGLYTSDEEIASPSSRPVIEAEAKDARAVFNSEPGRPSGNLVSRRKGAAFIELEVTGRAAHSGAAHAQGISAIEALARKIQRLHRPADRLRPRHDGQCRARAGWHGGQHGRRACHRRHRCPLSDAEHHGKDSRRGARDLPLLRIARQRGPHPARGQFSAARAG
jgi:glutamate carboxypeptidase